MIDCKESVLAYRKEACRIGDSDYLQRGVYKLFRKGPVIKRLVMFWSAEMAIDQIPVQKWSVAMTAVKSYFCAAGSDVRRTGNQYLQKS